MPEAQLDVHLPRPLSTVLDSLKDDPYLYEDVWVEKVPGGPPRWLSDQACRRGIKGVLRLDRCTEEKARLSRESSNMERWFAAEVKAVAIALRISQRDGMSTPTALLIYD
jgi:hypothetical protein